jgi:DNA-directed RNA polymerase subunit RPC12/RpoP
MLVGVPHNHDEYMCTRCGHPLLFRPKANIHVDRKKFQKKVRYLCSLFGHKVHPVTQRQSPLNPVGSGRRCIFEIGP